MSSSSFYFNCTGDNQNSSCRSNSPPPSSPQLISPPTNCLSRLSSGLLLYSYRLQFHTSPPPPPSLGPISLLTKQILGLSTHALHQPLPTGIIIVLHHLQGNQCLLVSSPFTPPPSLSLPPNITIDSINSIQIEEKAAAAASATASLLCGGAFLYQKGRSSASHSFINIIVCCSPPPQRQQRRVWCIILFISRFSYFIRFIHNWFCCCFVWKPTQLTPLATAPFGTHPKQFCVYLEFCNIVAVLMLLLLFVVRCDVLFRFDIHSTFFTVPTHSTLTW